jgi:seryl-tRNA synthetase
MEASFAGHRAVTGKYSATLTAGGKTIAKDFNIVANPLNPQKPADEKQYHETLTAMEADLTAMHTMVNSLHQKRLQLDVLLAKIPADTKYDALKKEGKALSDSLKAWDESMVQRKSKAYDDVENFPNKFTADYLYMMNQTENDIALITQPTLDLMKEMNGKWDGLKQKGTKMMDTDIPALNKKLFDAGIGAIWMK